MKLVSLDYLDKNMLTWMMLINQSSRVVNDRDAKLDEMKDCLMKVLRNDGDINCIRSRLVE